MIATPSSRLPQKRFTKTDPGSRFVLCLLTLFDWYCHFYILCFLCQIFLAAPFAGSPRCAFTLTRNVAAPAVALFQSSSNASSKMSASCAPANVAFPPSPTHLFTAFSRAWLSHKYSMGFVTGVPRNAKTKAASSGRFELDLSSSRPTFLCCFFFLQRRFAYPAHIFFAFG